MIGIAILIRKSFGVISFKILNAHTGLQMFKQKKPGAFEERNWLYDSKNSVMWGKLGWQSVGTNFTKH